MLLSAIEGVTFGSEYSACRLLWGEDDSLADRKATLVTDVVVAAAPADDDAVAALNNNSDYSAERQWAMMKHYRIYSLREVMDNSELPL